MGSVRKSRKVSHAPTDDKTAALHVAVLSFVCADYSGYTHIRANSIYLHNNIMETEFNLREEYFTKARSAIFALSSLLTVTFSLVLKGNNFLGDKKKTSGIFKEWARLLNYEAALVKGIIESDKKRYKRYQSKKTWSKIVSFKFFCEFLDYLKQELWEYIKRDGNPKPKKNETDNTNESEVVLPEDIFNIEESE